MPEFNYQDVSVIYDEESLTIANRCLRRKISLTNGILRTLELRDLRTNCIVAAENPEFDFNFIGYNTPAKNSPVYQITAIDVQKVSAGDFDSAHVIVAVSITEQRSPVNYVREFIIYPNLPVLSVCNRIRPGVMPNIYWTYRQKMRCDSNRELAGPLFSAVDALTFAPGFIREKTVEFFGRTDEVDNQVLEHCPCPAEQACGNLLFTVNPHTSAGAVILQEAPPSAERRDMENADFYFRNQTVYSCNWGVAPHEIMLNQEFKSYRHTVILFADAAERQIAVQRYLKIRYPAQFNHHTIMVNPWGGGDFYNRLNSKFLHDEINGAAELAAESYQIDDSWQKGASLWELIGSNHAPAPDFWQVAADKLPEGLEPFVKQAAENQLELALWTAPSCNLDYIDAENFGNMLLDYHHKFGFRFFKIDGMTLRTYCGEQRLTEMFRRVRMASNGQIYFNLDVTNGQRGGYFYLLEYGNLFLQNRYVTLNWGIGYHPEKTLRSLWRLARYCRTQYLQIEVPYRAAGLRKSSADNPSYHCMPECYPQEYWAAIALFANPLLWLYPSEVAPADAQVLRNVMILHKKYRRQIFSGDILPIGREPDGRTITGLQSHNAADNSGLIIVFREYGCAYSNDDLTLAVTLPDKCVLSPVAGHGNAKMTNGKLQVEIPMPADWALFKY